MELNYSSNEDLMEPLTIVLKVETFGKGRWQWRSNPDPWSKSEAPQWENYSLEHNYLIEKAYYDQQKEVDLGDYVISLKHLIQKKKGAAIQQRPIRRVSWEGDVYEKDRSSRYFETELPKTINKVFKSLSDFVSFFSRRSPAILDFTSRFEEIEESNDLVCLNLGIVPVVVCCLEIELMKPILEQLEDPSLSLFKKKILSRTKERHEELISLFKKEFGSFEEFYGEILRAYTMNTSLYENLNRYLRNESWTEIDNLLPYAFCLCKAFFNFKLQVNSSEGHEVIRIEPEPWEPKSIIIYRGTALDEGYLCFYKNSQAAQQHFSWNCVTSTSKNIEIAKKFMYENVDLEKEKYPVLFIIEAPIPEDDSESEYLKWVDIQKYSAKTEETEVILAPGSVFEVVKISTDKDQRTKIKLKMIQSLAHRGQIMQGALQMTEKDVKIVCLEGGELFDALKCLAGNRLVEEIEFCLCTFEKKSLELMVETVSTLERAKKLKFISCVSSDKEKISGGLKKWNIATVEIFDMNDFSQIFVIQNDDDRHWMSLSKFEINLINKKNLDLQLFQGLKDFTQLTSLNLSFLESDCLTDQEIHNLTCDGLQYLTQLTSLTFDFSCFRISDKGIHSMASDGLQYLTKLTSLTLNFPSSEEITNQGVHALADGLQYLINLTFLALHFKKCKQITDEGIHSLTLNGLQNLTQLASFTLHFPDSKRITNNGFKALVSDGLQYLTQLTSLALHFPNLQKVTDDGMRCLATQGIRHLTHLISLTLYFSDSHKITDKGVQKLAAEGLKHLTQLTSLTLHFSSCDKITDAGFHSLAFQGLQHLTHLTSLNLNFESCDEITDNGLSSLASQGLRYLTQLTSLAVRFSERAKITDEGIQRLISEGLGHLSSFVPRTNGGRKLEFEFNPMSKSRQTQQTFQSSNRKKLILKRILNSHSNNPSTLTFKNSANHIEGYSCLLESYRELKECLMEIKTSMSYADISNHYAQLESLTLDFNDCNGIKDEQFQKLVTEGFKHFIQLTSLTLNFLYCNKITDQGLSCLASQGFPYLTQLTSLTLNFQFIYKITDKGVSSLAIQGFQYLTQLTSLTIFFQCFGGIMSKGVRSLASDGLKYLTQLRALKFHLSGEERVTDKGIQILATKGLKYLTHLTSLDLYFESSHAITDKGVRRLTFQGLKLLPQLTSLTLCFNSCSKITDEGVNYLTTQALRHLTQLTSLSLDFSDCDKITKFALSNVLRALCYFGFVLSDEKDDENS